MRTSIGSNNRRYAALHGYAYYHETKIVRNPGQRYSTDAFFLKEHIVVGEMRRGHEWVLHIDLDAIFVDFATSLDDIIRGLELTTPPRDATPPSFVFSGDTCIINAGVILVRNSAWSKALMLSALELGREPEWDGKNAIGMKGDNAALAILLAGCPVRSTQAQRVACYDRVDRGWRDVAFERRIRAGDAAALASTVAPEVLPHVRLLAQERFQAYALRAAKFILHYPSQDDWRNDPAYRDGLLPMYMGRAPETKADALRVALQATSCGTEWSKCFKQNAWWTSSCGGRQKRN